MAISFNKRFIWRIMVLGVAALGAGCAAIGPTDNPFLRSLTWDRYVGGDDIARACAPGQPAVYRLVYNAVEREQQRTYDIHELPEGGAMLEARVVGPANLNDSRNPISLQDPLAPWRGQSAMYRLSDADFAKIKSALTEAGFEQAAPKGLFLRGDSFFWTASACRNGEFHFHAWGSPSPEFDRMAVPLLEAVLPYDKTGVPARRPYEVALPPYSIYLMNDPATGRRYIPRRFQVGDNGLQYSQGTIN
ncbi:MAG TPA: hypothetical protein VF194_07785 [Ferrovibrio sp.]|uniref:hypothetical protein n=1 Tax=Ferrovibrio sp. TaxID=1917215 RepID=UPI002ED14899